MRVNTFSR